MYYPLDQLDAHFLKWAVAIADENHGRILPDGTMQWGGFEVDTFQCVDKLSDADGIYFECPKCHGTHTSHGIHVYFKGKNVPERLGKNSKGETVRWSAEGTGLHDLVLRPSILLEGPGCEWHGFVGCNGIPPGYAG